MMSPVIKFKKQGILLLLIFFISQSFLLAQERSYPYDIEWHPFIHYKDNKIEFPADSTAFLSGLQKIHNMVTKGEGRLQILQIGGSHIQADIYSNQARKRLQTIYPGLNGGRGFVFPYKIAKTNNPVNLKVEYEGEWESCRNVIKKQSTQTLGLAGISVTTRADTASFKIFNYKCEYDFNRVKLFYDFDSLNYDISLGDSVLIDSSYTDTVLHYTTYWLSEYTDTLFVKLIKKDTLAGKFTFYGADLETDDPGIVYHSIGINGASIPSFLRCQLFEEQLKALQVDWVVLSLGTNDAYHTKFDSSIYYANYDTLIQRILQANPKTAIIITVPNDDYYHKRYPNPFTQKQEEVIYRLAKKYNAGVWNLYKIMGGFNSSQIWFDNGLMRYDRIHFTHHGYILKGDLYFNALLRMYDYYIASLNTKK